MTKTLAKVILCVYINESTVLQITMIALIIF